MSAAWSAIAPAELDSWNARLRGSDASVFQYPLWNEPLRAMRFAPRYLAFAPRGPVEAYVCVLTIGVPGAQIGLVQRGPVALGAAAPSTEMLRELAAWARGCGYMFLRVTHHSQHVLDAALAAGGVTAEEPFPFYRDLRDELIVEQHEDDERTLGTFQAIARRKIRKAEQAGYELRCSDAPEALDEVWPLFQRLAARKQFRFRPLGSYHSLLRHAQPHGGARVYVAALGGRPVEAIVTVRDRATAYYISGALDLDALDGHESPSCLLHWRAMRDYAALGARFYHLGTRSGAVYQFKRQFRPHEHHTPPPVVLVTHPRRYQLWRAIALRLGPQVWPHAKRLIFR